MSVLHIFFFQYRRARQTDMSFPPNPNGCFFSLFVVHVIILLSTLAEGRGRGDGHSGGSGGAFNIRSYGAAGDGVTDDSKALLAAWNAACAVPSAVLQIPSGFVFLIGGPITLQGPCKPHFVLQIDGVILGPSDISNWPHSNLLQWINLKWVDQFTIRGSGTVNGRGSAWWRQSRRGGGTRPTAIRFFGSRNVVVEGITIANSPQCHLKFNGCDGVLVKNIKISSPANSPNTDGIHLQNTINVEIWGCTIACGDDCISTQTGCTGIHIEGIRCGPGHGISIGGLGQGNSYACVSNVTVQASSFRDTMTGVRIKSWQGGKGFVKDVTFTGIAVTNVDMPIVVDQNYCNEGHSCRSGRGTVTVSDVTFSGITGTYAVQPVYLDCDDRIHCNVKLTNVRLSVAPGGSRGNALCKNAFGESAAPFADCVRRGTGDGGSSSRSFPQCKPEQSPP